VAYAADVGAAKVNRSTDPEILLQFQPRGYYCVHVEPVTVVNGNQMITDESLDDVCVRNRARARTHRAHERYGEKSGFVDVLSELQSPNHVGDRVAEVHGYRFFGNQEPERLIYQVMSLCNEVLRYHVSLHPFHQLVCTNALFFACARDRDVQGGATNLAAGCAIGRRLSSSRVCWHRTLRYRVGTTPG